MKAIRFDGTLKVVSDAPEVRRAGEALIEVLCAGICNTDLEIVKGYAGFYGTLGHEFVGRVIESPEQSLIGQRVVGEINAGCGVCDLCRKGDSRHCADRTVLGIKNRDGAFAQYVSLPPRNLIPVPDSIPNDAAVFVEPLAAAHQILEQVDIAPSANVAVIGDGKLAQLIIRVIAQAGCHLTVIGKHAEKIDLVRPFARQFILLESNPDPAAVLRRVAGEKFDYVVEASGSEAGLPLAVNIIKPGGTIILKSTHHGLTSLDMSQIVVNEIHLVGSRCGRFQPALELLERRAVDVRPLITRTMPLEEGLLAFEEAKQPGSLKVILQISAN